MYNHYYYDDYYSPQSTNPEATGFIAIILAYLGIILVFSIATYVLTSIATMGIFKKAGLPGWKAWVPLYNNWLFFELGGYNGALIFLGLIPFFGPIALFISLCLAANEIGKKLDKSDIFILFPLGVFTGGITTIIWYCITGFGKSTWNDALGKESLAKDTILGYVSEDEYMESVDLQDEPVAENTTKKTEK